MARPYALAALLWAAVMFFAASTRTQAEIFCIFPQEDKLLHFLEYALFSLLLYRAFRHAPERRVIRQAGLLSAGVAVAYGCALELYQLFLPWRDASALDLMANCAGAAFTLGLVWRSGE